LNLAVKEPETFTWDPNTDVELKPGQIPQLDTNDPLTYRSYVHFPQPLPLDKLIALNEIQSLLSLGLESKEGALRVLGEEFPAEKLNEIRKELQDDAIADGALKLLQTQIEQEIMELTGTMPPPEVGAPGAGKGADAGISAPMAPPALDDAAMASKLGETSLRTQLVTKAYGTKLPQRRVPEEYEK
jgi:hypothetical protein